MLSMQLLRSKKFVIPLTVLFAISALLYGLRGTKRVAMDWAPLYTSISSSEIEPTCPSLHVVHSPVKLLPQEGLQCHSIDSALSEFTVDACYNPKHCGAIDLVLKRTDKKNVLRWKRSLGNSTKTLLLISE